MPRKLCFAALLLSSLLTGNCLAQQFESSTFGAKVAARLSTASEMRTPPDPARSEAARPGEKEPSSLVAPAVFETPDRYVPAEQQASHTESSGDMSQQDAAVPSEGVPSPKLANDLLSASAPDRDQGFPSLSRSGEEKQGSSRPVPSTEGLGSVVTVISSLAVVLGLFFMTAWLMRRTGAGGLASLPSDVFELLGRAPLNNRQQVHLMRCGTKLLLVSVTQDGAETLTEIDDPDEVTRLAGLCKANQAGSASAAFRQVLHQFAGQPAEPGFVGRTDPRTARAEYPSELENLHG